MHKEMQTEEDIVRMSPRQHKLFRDVYEKHPKDV